MDPTVSIIIPFYNCAYVDQAIQSALNQTYPNIEIIVVDDGSTKFREKIDSFHENIVYIKKKNKGTATALNRGICEASGEYVAWLSSDDYFLPEKISKQINFMLSHKLDLSFTNYDCIDEDNNVIVPWNCQRFTNLKEIYESYLTYNEINGCTVVIKKEIFDKMGCFNPLLRYTHDYEMWFRLLVNGIRIEYLDEVLTKFRIHEESGTKKYQRKMLEEMALIESQYRPLLKEYIKSL
ncbi:glycosyltransferase [Fictibacillus terranigra]|uniref:Glycosyltransferase n=1 Tax=Fictibacillus terranigra TaxID=3058424 RepID=A0ABT8E6X7_9BACL|nr:glycosyltransferase [Fictibacillus sp. CENA-BCM004]MDN4073663.1 glycosyltransferase [Fictibacillus sp. CENA-BCM004]